MRRQLRPRPKTIAERKADERARRRAQGFSAQTVWVHVEDVERFRRYVNRLRREREGTS